MTRSAAETPERALPADMMLPLLRAVSADGLDATLRRLGLREPFEAFEPLKHHPASRLTFGFRAAGRPLVAKAYKGDASEQAALLQALARHGLAGGRPPTAPPLVAYDAGLRVVVTARLDGVSGPPLFAAGARVAELGADWLARQWAAPIALGRRLDTGAFMSRVERDGAQVAAFAPDLAGAVTAVLAALARRPPALRAPVLAHGSFSVNHILDMGTGAGVLDWDGFGQGARELDAATFLSTLARVTGGDAGLAAAAARAAEAFRAAIAPDIEEPTLAWFEAGTRVRNARHLCAVEPPGWAERAARLVADACRLAGVR